LKTLASLPVTVGYPYTLPVNVKKKGIQIKEEGNK
jgi:hypothetical protein